jgi:branched-chain amino acid transport system permease protein
MLRSRTFLIVVPALLVLALLPLGVGGYILGLLTLAYYYAVFAMSWDLLFGFAGEVNFGPSFLIGVGAYTAALLNHYWLWPIPFCLVAGAFAAVIAGAVLAVPALRCCFYRTSWYCLPASPAGRSGSTCPTCCRSMTTPTTTTLLPS